MEILQGIEHLHTLDGADFVAFDVETTGLQPKYGGLRLLQLATFGQPPVVMDCWSFSDDDWIALEDFCGKKRVWLAHNAVFDIGWLQEHEIHLEGTILCSLLASRILTNGLPNIKHGLQHVVKRYLRLDLSKEEQKSDWSGQLSANQIEYAARDVLVLVELYELLRKMLSTGNLMPAWRLECKALPAMAQLWRTGLPFDKDMLTQVIEQLHEEAKDLGGRFITRLDAALPAAHKIPREDDTLDIVYEGRYAATRDTSRLQWLKDKVTEMGHEDEDYYGWYAEIEAIEAAPDEITEVAKHRGAFNLRAKAEGSKRLGTYKPAGFNLNSPKQLLDKFTALLGEVPIDEATDRPSASKAALREYAGDHPVVADYLRWKRTEKRRQMAETLLTHIGWDGHIRASYIQLGADTGRMSCMSPNLQQIPRDQRFRACVQAPTGWRLVVADYGQMELRLAAAEAQDSFMTQVFQQGKDLHTITATQIYGVKEEDVTKDQRQVSKSANFGLLYGSGARGLRNYAATQGIQMDLAEAAEIRRKFHNAYQGIAEWQQQNARAANAASDNSFICIRKSGLRRFLPGKNNKLTTRCNTPIQGAGAAVLKLTLGKLWPLLKSDGEDVVRLAGVVHDEIILLVREQHAELWAAQLQGVMEDAEAQWLGEIGRAHV